MSDLATLRAFVAREFAYPRVGGSNDDAELESFREAQALLAATSSEPAITQLAGDIYRLDGAEVFEVPSRSRPGVLHLVVRHVGWHCTCPASVTACFHVKRVREALADIHDLPERTP